MSAPEATCGRTITTPVEGSRAGRRHGAGARRPTRPGRAGPRWGTGTCGVTVTLPSRPPTRPAARRACPRQQVQPIVAAGSDADSSRRRSPGTAASPADRRHPRRWCNHLRGRLGARRSWRRIPNNGPAPCRRTWTLARRRPDHAPAATVQLGEPVVEPRSRARAQCGPSRCGDRGDRGPDGSAQRARDQLESCCDNEARPAQLRQAFSASEMLSGAGASGMTCAVRSGRRGALARDQRHVGGAEGGRPPVIPP